MARGTQARLAVLVLWLAAASGFLVSPSPLATAARVLFGLLVVAHLVECLLFLPRLRAAPGPLGRHLALTFVFGLAHVRELDRGKGAGARRA